MEREFEENSIALKQSKKRRKKLNTLKAKKTTELIIKNFVEKKKGSMEKSIEKLDLDNVCANGSKRVDRLLSLKKDFGPSLSLPRHSSASDPLSLPTFPNSLLSLRKNFKAFSSLRKEEIFPLLPLPSPSPSPSQNQGETNVKEFETLNFGSTVGVKQTVEASNLSKKDYFDKKNSNKKKRKKKRAKRKKTKQLKTNQMKELEEIMEGKQTKRQLSKEKESKKEKGEVRKRTAKRELKNLGKEAKKREGEKKEGEKKEGEKKEEEKKEGERNALLFTFTTQNSALFDSSLSELCFIFSQKFGTNSPQTNSNNPQKSMEETLLLFHKLSKKKRTVHFHFKVGSIANESLNANASGSEFVELSLEMKVSVKEKSWEKKRGEEEKKLEETLKNIFSSFHLPFKFRTSFLRTWEEKNKVHKSIQLGNVLVEVSLPPSFLLFLTQEEKKNLALNSLQVSFRQILSSPLLSFRAKKQQVSFHSSVKTHDGNPFLHLFKARKYVRRKQRTHYHPSQPQQQLQPHQQTQSQHQQIQLQNQQTQLQPHQQIQLQHQQIQLQPHQQLQHQQIQAQPQVQTQRKLLSQSFSTNNKSNFVPFHSSIYSSLEGDSLEEEEFGSEEEKKMKHFQLFPPSPSFLHTKRGSTDHSSSSLSSLQQQERSINPSFVEEDEDNSSTSSSSSYESNFLFYVPKSL